MITQVVSLPVQDIKITGELYLPGERQGGYPTVAICHGIPARISLPGESGYPLLARRVCDAGFAVLIFNFRGTGTSGGNFDIMGWIKDLEAAINYLWALPQVDQSRLSLLGFSGGAAVSIYVAAQDTRVSSLVSCACPAQFTFHTDKKASEGLIAQFRRIGIIRDNAFPPIIKEWLDGFRQVSPVDHIAGLAPRPLLLVHGSQDEVVAVADARKLYAHAQEPKQLVLIDGGRHRLRQNEDAMTIVIDWLKSSRR